MIENDTLPAFIFFLIAATITPGPNNIMVMASGVNFGFRRSLPHLCGIATGVFATTLLVGLGLTTILEIFPFLEPGLRGLSVVYLLWLAWKIANGMPIESEGTAVQPLTFTQAATFQAANPKIWTTALSIITLFASGRSLVPVSLVALAFAIIGLASNAIWTVIGVVLRRWLAVGRRLKFFNIAMALLLVASLYPVLLT